MARRKRNRTAKSSPLERKADAASKGKKPKRKRLRRKKTTAENLRWTAAGPKPVITGPVLSSEWHRLIPEALSGRLWEARKAARLYQGWSKMVGRNSHTMQ